ncbi:MAG: hypothetical protein ACLRWH_00200 [Emergencia sp.]
MPAFYAHYRFGKQVAEEMKRRAKEETTASAIDAESVQKSMGRRTGRDLFGLSNVIVPSLISVCRDRIFSFFTGHMRRVR